MPLRRAKLYQSWGRHPEEHSQVLCALFGTTELDRHRLQLIWGRPTKWASPRTRQVAADLDTVSHRIFYEGIRRVSEDLRLWLDRDAAEQFVIIDIGEVRQTCCSFHITLPGLNAPGNERFPSQQADVDMPFVCGLGKEGVPCGCAFSTRKGLLNHLRHRHYLRSLMHMLTPY
eukprot:9497420-Pyramimonas_sp.AAC.1